jgi:hypothetical protein
MLSGAGGKGVGDRETLSCLAASEGSQGAITLHSIAQAQE